MTSASRPAFLRNFGRPTPPPGLDLADMGTAFALDESLDSVNFEARQSGASPKAPRAVPVASWRLWLGRKLGA